MSVNKVGSNGSLTPIATRGQFTQYSTMPTASVDIVNKIVQYIGATNQNYTNGYFYKCVLSGSNYIWTNINVQAGGSGSDNIVNGYFNPTDNLFYEESTYTTAITGASNVLYISLDTDFSYRYNGLIFVRVDNEIDDTTTTSNKTWSSNKISSEIVPNGSTVTPTDDIATWLACAGLHQSYTTLNEVLADSAVLSALMASTNAVDYLVRSTTWATDICANELAMAYIGANNYCANTLLANSTWRTAICNSTYFESVLNVKVPTMTSNITPSGVCSQGSRSWENYPAWKSFDNDNTTFSVPLNDSTSDGEVWVQYQFTSPVCVNKVNFMAFYDTAYANQRQTVTFKVQGSNNGSTWSDLYTANNYQYPNSTDMQTVDFENSTKYQYYRIWYSNSIIKTTGGVYFTYYRTLQFYGRSDYPIGNDDTVDTNANISAIAYNEDGTTCKNPNGYKIGEHFYRNAKFCTAKTDIAYGAQFTLGTNYVEGTVADCVPFKKLLASYSYTVTANAGQGFINYEQLSVPMNVYDFLLVCVYIDTYSESRLIPFTDLTTAVRVRSTNPDYYVPIITINLTGSSNQIANYVYNTNAMSNKEFKVKLYGIKLKEVV